MMIKKLILVIGISSLLLLSACYVRQDGPLPSSVPTYIEIKDSGSNITNIKNCVDAFRKVQDEYNTNNIGSYLTFSGEYKVTCENGVCLCQ